MNLSGFFILVGLIYSYFLLQYYFTQTFYLKYNIIFLFILAVFATTLILIISAKGEQVENILMSLGILYYAFLLLLVKLTYRFANSYFIKRGKIKEEFLNKGFTYISYHKGIFFKGHSWNRDIATNPSWLDHVLSWVLILLPILCVVLSLLIYRNGS